MDFMLKGAGGRVFFFPEEGAVLHSRVGSLPAPLGEFIIIVTQYSAATLKKIGTDEWVVIGDLV